MRTLVLEFCDHSSNTSTYSFVAGKGVHIPKHPAGHAEFVHCCVPIQHKISELDRHADFARLASYAGTLSGPCVNNLHPVLRTLESEALRLSRTRAGAETKHLRLHPLYRFNYLLDSI